MSATVEDAREVSPTEERVRAALEGLEATFVTDRDGMLCVEPARDAVRDVLERLKQRAGFESVTLVTGVDRDEVAPRFEVIHQLRSLAHTDRVRVRTRLEENDARIATCVDLWGGAAFMERECYDMFGIVFEGHENLRRLLMPEEYGHHPLRKDFPHQGIEPDRLYREWDRKRREAEE